MHGKLPRWRKDDVEFVCRALARHPENINITDLVRDLGLEDVHPSGSKTEEYMRVRAALHAAFHAGRVLREGRVWGLVTMPPAARAG